MAPRAARRSHAESAAGPPEHVDSFQPWLSLSPARAGWSSGLGLLALFYITFVYAVPRPASLTPGAWSLAGLFLTTVLGSIIEPVPAGALVLMAVTLAPLTGALKITESLGGFADTTAWLVMAAFFISRALIDTGLARRIALGFVRWFGHSTLGVCYALGASDMVLGHHHPFQRARATGGAVLPVARSIAALYGSEPGPTAKRVGAFLMVGVYQAICVTAAMFYTGQASNPAGGRRWRPATATG